MKEQLSRERLEKIASWHEKFGSGHNVMLPAEEAEAMARMLLAGMDSEPLAVIDKEGNPMTRAECNDDRVFAICCKVGTPLYTAPPAPVAVPDEFVIPEVATLTNIDRLCPLDVNLSQTDFATGWNECRQFALENNAMPPVVKGISAYCQGWNACRAAMLKAEPVTVKCPKCGGTGLADSGGMQPWGEPISVPCDCTIPAETEQE